MRILAGLRSEGVSYLFAGRTGLDLGLTLEILNRELGVKRLILEGGGVSNGAFLRACLVSFEAIEGPINDLIDDAYRARYRGSRYIEPMIRCARPLRDHQDHAARREILTLEAKTETS